MKEKFHWLAAVIAAHPDHRVIGRTRLQKTVKLLQRLGAPLDYDYMIHFYGPYSEGVQSDIGLLENLGFVTEKTRTKDDGSPYFILEAGSLTVAIDGGIPGEPPTAVAPDHGMRVAEIYLNLDTASQEEASGFDGLFEVVFSGFDWSFGAAYPDWGYCASNTYTRGRVAKVSCVSDNLGGERLVAS